MKKFHCLFIILFAFNGASSQSCLPEGIHFTSQEQIDNFPVNYPSCKNIEGSVYIKGEDIANLNGLSDVTSIGHDLVIGSWDEGGNPALSSLSGLTNLHSIGEGLFILENTSLLSLSGLANLDSIGGALVIGRFYHGNPALTNLVGLEGLKTIRGEFTIASNTGLTSLSGLDNITSVGGKLSIEGNSKLINLTGLNNLTTIGEGLSFAVNDALTSLTGLEGLTSIEGYLEISDNFVNLIGLDNLAYIGGHVYLQGGYLESLTGLGSLTTIGGDFLINNIDFLASLEGLENLTLIGGSLLIDNNDHLPNLTGIHNIDKNSITGLWITHNSILTTCEVKSVCDYLTTPNGTIEIHDNAIGCNSQQEVKTACGLGFDENNASENQINIYPNPASTTITLELLTVTGIKDTYLTIYNLNGQRLIMQTITEPKMDIDITALLSGVYFVRMYNERTVMVEKILKQ